MAEVFFYDRTRRALHVDRVLSVIASAEEEVFVINWPAREPDAVALDDSRNRYFQGLLNTCERKNLRYTRILQIAQRPGSDARQAIFAGYDRHYIQHFQEMLHRQSETVNQGAQCVIELLTIPLTIPGTFVIVDGAHLMW